MDKTMHKMEIVGDTSLEQAFQTYCLLSEEVRRWQDERGSFEMEELSPAKTPPYYLLVDFPEIIVMELWKRLNQVIGLIVSEAALRETWKRFKNGQSLSEPELSSNLQIALTGIAHHLRARYIKSKKDAKNNQGQNHPEEAARENDSCPICGEHAMLSILSQSNGQRFIHCTMCGHEWPTARVGCIHCGSEEATEQSYLQSEEFPGIELVVCEACGQYFKELDLRTLTVADFIWEDVRTLPLNYAAEQWLADHAKQSGNIQ